MEYSVGGVGQGSYVSYMVGWRGQGSPHIVEWVEQGSSSGYNAGAAGAGQKEQGLWL